MAKAVEVEVGGSVLMPTTGEDNGGVRDPPAEGGLNGRSWAYVGQDSGCIRSTVVLTCAVGITMSHEQLMIAYPTRGELDLYMLRIDLTSCRCTYRVPDQFHQHSGQWRYAG